MAGSSSKFKKGGKKGNEKQMDVFRLESLPKQVLSKIVTKTNLQDVVTLRMVNKNFCKLASAESTLKHLLSPKIMEMGMQTGSDGTEQFDAQAVFKHISHLWAMAKSLDLVSIKSFCLNLLEVGGEFFDAESAKVCFMDPNTGKMCLAVAAYHPSLTITSRADHFYEECEGLFKNPHWMSMLKDSRFDTSAYFHMDYMLDITGHFEARLSPGRYSFSWVWRFQEGKWDVSAAMNPAMAGREKMISITSMFTDGEVYYDWTLSTYYGRKWEVEWERDPPACEGYSRSTLKLVKSAIKSVKQKKNLKVKGSKFLEHEIGQFRVEQENAMGHFETSVLDFELHDELGTLGAGEGLRFDGFIIRHLD